MPSDEALPSMDGMDSYFPTADQNMDTFTTDLSWEDWLSSGYIADPGFNMPQDFPQQDMSASRCPSFDSNASSDQSTSQGWPTNFLEDPQFNFASCPQRTVQQDIESCVPQLPHWSPVESLTSTTTNEELPPPKTKKTVSPTKTKHGSRTKPEHPSKEPAKKEAKAKTTTSNRTAHSVIEHNYRQNLNGKMDQLRQILSTADASKCVDDESEDASYSITDNQKPLSKTTTTTTPPKTRKSDVLIHAYSYVQRSEQEKKIMLAENAWLKRRLVAGYKLVNCEVCSFLKQINLGGGGGGGGGGGYALRRGGSEC